jgi:hypothetical protein
MYTERFAVDGCMFSFIKSINDDYIRYEQIIKSTIERYDLCLMFSLSHSLCISDKMRCME